ncbi:STAS domain-containing protein [Micromonospora endolithica]|uniref:Anti-sigma factor antagonist n=1 Tax=Micromonospora endolithica TaxID=230091 RepID=A0A3A9ZI74_9ACTN|nr:STAS domain-containing protein [Micromonospora endolithica]RKN47839.1 anti-sigma factor antagonist [Micromonospora endolithica]TWJ21529.1 anti-anti-sigma factor [Micromonospora endolithica]
MTVVPEENTMILICDGCGDTAASAAVVLPDAEVVWTLVSDHGWSGSPFATGPHRCTRCTPLPGADGMPLGVDDLDGPDVVGTAPRSASDALRDALARSVERDGRMAVDLTGVDQIATTDLGLLVRARQEARQRGVVLWLVAPSRFVLTVLHTMRLDGAFPIAATRAEALGAVAPPSEVLV